MSVIVRGVSKRMGKNDVLRNVSIEVDPGTVVGLQGINGSGKTMLMRAVCGLIKPTEGEISIDGQRLGADISFPPSLGMLIEAPSFLGYLSGYDNLKLIAQIKGVATPEDIRSALRLVGLDADEKKKFRAYSLGMKQRLGIAAAISCLFSMSQRMPSTKRALKCSSALWRWRHQRVVRSFCPAMTERCSRNWPIGFTACATVPL